MAFSASSSNEANTDTCDRCHKPAAEDRPLLRLQASDRYDHSVIFLHVDCIQRIIARTRA